MPIELSDSERNLLTNFVQTTLCGTATHHTARREMLIQLLAKLKGTK